MTTEERLAKVERELVATKRRSRWLLAALGLTAGAFALAWIFAGSVPALRTQAEARAERVVRANRFVLEDADGRERAVLQMHADDPVLRLYDAAEMCRTVLSLGGLGMFDATGQLRAGLTLTPTFSLWDAAGQLRVRLGRGSSDIETPGSKTIIYPESSLRLYGADGKMIWRSP